MMRNQSMKSSIDSVQRKGFVYNLRSLPVYAIFSILFTNVLFHLILRSSTINIHIVFSPVLLSFFFSYLFVRDFLLLTKLTSSKVYIVLLTLFLILIILLLLSFLFLKFDFVFPEI